MPGWTSAKTETTKLTAMLEETTAVRIERPPMMSFNRACCSRSGRPPSVTTRTRIFSSPPEGRGNAARNPSHSGSVGGPCPCLSTVRDISSRTSKARLGTSALAIGSDERPSWEKLEAVG